MDLILPKKDGIARTGKIFQVVEAYCCTEFLNTAMGINYFISLEVLLYIRVRTVP